MREFAAMTIIAILASATLINSGLIRRSVHRRRTDMDGGRRARVCTTNGGGAAVGLLMVIGCATAIGGFTVGGNRAVSPLMCTVAAPDEAFIHLHQSSLVASGDCPIEGLGCPMTKLPINVVPSLLDRPWDMLSFSSGFHETRLAPVVVRWNSPLVGGQGQ